jgi:2-polyprenyl-6-methoxyphenol hydroxylase-like FAD-dependent oxidoreductase
MEHTEVLVVGAGPAGVSLALELGLHGRSCVVAEAQARAGLAPRAKTTNVRTRELMRRWGIADRLAQLAPFGVNYPSNVVFATGMRGPELARFHNAFHNSPQRDDRFCEHSQWIPQYKVEQVLRERAFAFPTVTLRESTRLVEFAQDGDGVTATLEDGGTGRRRQIRARYLVGADGSRSTVREQLGIEMDGVSPLSQHRNYIFRAPALASLHSLGPAVMYWLVTPEFPSVLAPLDTGDLWTFGCSLGDVKGDPAQMIRGATGLDFDLEILSQDDWTAHQLIARQYQSGRVFLVGDACHLHPPFGGHGMNMGIGDSVDLGWKLGAALAGWGTPRLLGSYGIERHQVHRRVVDESVSNHRHLPSSFNGAGLAEPGPQGDARRAAVRERILESKRPEFDSLGLVIGYHYEESPTLLREAADRPPRQPTPDYQPSARPGCRSPHMWLAAGRGAGASLFDHYDASGFTLIETGGRRGPGTDAFVKITAEAGIPLRCIAPAAKGLRELFGADYALIRPDQHVAWRGNDLERAARALRIACGH